MKLKELFKDLGLSGLTLKQKIIVGYFIISLCLVGSVVEAPAWALVILVLNFGNATRLLKTVPFPELED
jgi:hypothetical protein